MDISLFSTLITFILHFVIVHSRQKLTEEKTHNSNTLKGLPAICHK